MKNNPRSLRHFEIFGRHNVLFGHGLSNGRQDSPDESASPKGATVTVVTLT